MSHNSYVLATLVCIKNRSLPQVANVVMHTLSLLNLFLRNNLLFDPLVCLLAFNRCECLFSELPEFSKHVVHAEDLKFLVGEELAVLALLCEMNIMSTLNPSKLLRRCCNSDGE